MTMNGLFFNLLEEPPPKAGSLYFPIPVGHKCHFGDKQFMESELIF